jgi:hypothetical protein
MDTQAVAGGIGVVPPEGFEPSISTLKARPRTRVFPFPWTMMAQRVTSPSRASMRGIDDLWEMKWALNGHRFAARGPRRRTT